MIPGGMTSLLQPLDTHINRPFKQWLREAVEEETAKWELQNPGREWSVSDKRVLTTHAVAAAFQRLQDHSATIQKSFKDLGISIAADGSEDHLINIKGVDTAQIELQGWEQAEDVTLSSAADEAEADLDGLEEYITAQEEAGLGWKKLKNDDLRDICAGRGLRKGGKKEDLARRLHRAELIELRAQDN